MNTAERAFGILFALLALAVFSTLLATIASQTATLSTSTEERRHLFRQLGKFLGRHRIPPELSLRIHCFLALSSGFCLYGFRVLAAFL